MLTQWAWAWYLSWMHRPHFQKHQMHSMPVVYLLYMLPLPCFTLYHLVHCFIGQPQQQQPQQRGSESQGKYSKTPQKDEDEGLEEEEEDEHGETLCGACGENYASDEFWICCDICEKWFHGKCVKITPARAEHIKQYKCPSCSNKRSRPWYIKLMIIWCFHRCTLLSGSSLTALPVRFLLSFLGAVFSETCELNCNFSFGDLSWYNTIYL